jgi:hypothetical protein
VDHPPVPAGAAHGERRQRADGSGAVDEVVDRVGRKNAYTFWDSI